MTTFGTTMNILNAVSLGKVFFLLALGLAASGAQGATVTSVVPGAACPAMVWPRAAQRYEIQGTTTLSFSVDKAGRATDVSVRRSAGWAILDDAARAILAGCVFEAPRRDAVYGPVQFVWKLDGDAAVFHPLPLPGTCAPSPRFAYFKPFDTSRSDKRGIVLRMLVDPDGKARNPVAEAPGMPQELVTAAVAWALSCKYGIDPDAHGERTDTIFGKVIVKGS